MKLILALVVALVVVFPVALAESYVKEEITVLPDGKSYVEGFTDLDILGDLKPINEEINGYTDELTNKKGKFWFFSYQSLEKADAIVYLKFPKNTEINQVESPLDDSFSSENNRPVLTFKGDDIPLDIKVKYSLKKQAISFNWLYFTIPFVVAFVVIFFLLRKKLKKKDKKVKESKKSKQVIDEEKLKTIKLTLNENQLKILEALINKGGEASQTQLSYLTDVPKSSLSRNIELMSQKSVISKFYSGTSNYIKLHPSLYKEQADSS